MARLRLPDGVGFLTVPSLVAALVIVIVTLAMFMLWVRSIVDEGAMRGSITVQTCKDPLAEPDVRAALDGLPDESEQARGHSIVTGCSSDGRVSAALLARPTCPRGRSRRSISRSLRRENP